MNIAVILVSYITISTFILHASVTALHTNRSGRHLWQSEFQLGSNGRQCVHELGKVLKMFSLPSLRIFPRFSWGHWFARFFFIVFLNVMHMQCIRNTFTFHSLKPPSPPSELISQTLPSYLHVIFIPGDAKMLHLVQVFCSCAQLFFVTAKARFYLHGRVLHQPSPYYIQLFLFFCPIFFSAPCVMETAI